MVQGVRGLKVVHEQYEKLEHVVDNLNEKTRGLLLRERREFLAAYRAHTYKIQNELRELRRRVAEEQSSQQKDEKVKQLREDCDWFRQEALELDAKSATLRGDLHGLKDRLEIAEDDRNWLLKELTRTKMQTDLLRGALDAQTSDTKTADVVEAERRADDLAVEARRTRSVRSAVHRRSRVSADSTDASIAPEVEAEAPTPEVTEAAASRAETPGSPSRRSSCAFVADGAKERERDYLLRCVQAKRGECRRYRRSIAAHRAHADPPTHEAARLRAELLECLITVSHTKDARKGSEPRPRPRVVPEDRRAPGDDAPRNPDLSLLDPLDLDRFTPTDRVHTLYHFANAPAVQSILADVADRDRGDLAPAPAYDAAAFAPAPGHTFLAERDA